MKCKFTVIYPLPNTDPFAGARTARIADIKEFREARDLADINNGKVYPQLPDGLRDPIYPKPEAMLDWGDFNFGLCLAARVEKLPPEPMFKYRVEWHDANGAGEPESGIQYEGFCRQKALSEKHEADRQSCGGSITVLVPGPKGWYSPKEERARKEEEEYLAEVEAAYWDSVALKQDKECYNRRMARANKVETTVVSRKDKFGDFEYVLSVTFYDEEGYMQNGWSTDEWYKTIQEGARNLFTHALPEQKPDIEKSLKELGISW